MFGQLCSILCEYLSVFKKGPVAFEMGGGGIIKDPVNVEKLMQLHV